LHLTQDAHAAKTVEDKSYKVQWCAHSPRLVCAIFRSAREVLGYLNISGKELHAEEVDRKVVAGESDAAISTFMVDALAGERSSERFG